MGRIAVVVCGNGLGHFTRVVNVLAVLMASSDVRADVFSAPWQRERLRAWPRLAGLAGTDRVRFRDLESHVVWSSDPAYFRDPELLRWHEGLAELSLRDYDLVVSDNLVEPLAYRADTVLMGSFLWHDVYLASQPEVRIVREYHEFCASLLSRHRPPMVGNRYFSMPAVAAEADLVPVGMMESGRVSPEKEPDGALGVLLYGGSSPQVSCELLRLLQRGVAGAEGLGEIVFFGDRGVCRMAASDGAGRPTPWNYVDFSRIDAVVGRPGLGIVTESVASGTPIFCVHEGSPEMSQNSAVVEELGVGRALTSVEDALETAVSFLQEQVPDGAYAAARARLDRDGLAQAAGFIRQRLDSGAPGT